MPVARKTWLTLALFLVLGYAAPAARADSFTFNGSQSVNSPVSIFSFTVTSPSLVAINLTSSYDSTLSLFAGNGETLDITFDENGLPPFSATFPNLFLGPGQYFVSVTPFPLLPGGNLSEGFFFGIDGFGREFTFADFGFTAGTFTLQISGLGVTQAAPVPEPATMILLGTGLAGIVAGRRRRRARTDGGREG